MIPLLPLLAGFVAFAIGGAILRSFGPRYRVGRLLGTTPVVSVAEAIDLARSGDPRYVRVAGRIESDAEFEDADHRPLVLRRTTFQAKATRRGLAGGWATFETIHEAVPFEIRDGLEGIAVDHDALADGLVVVPRETSGVLGDLGDRAPADLPAGTPARVIVQLVSSVEHATVLGVPRSADDGGAVLGAGLGRPLVLTTLERDEAMRILTGGDAPRVRAAAVSLVAGAALSLAGIAWAVWETVR